MALGFVIKSLRNAHSQRLRDLFAAFASNDQSQLGLEVVSLEARQAVVQMSLDLHPPILGELAVEIVVDDVDRLAAIDVFALSGRICVLSHLGPLPAHARHRTRTTPSAAPFFRDAADSS